MSLSHPHGWVDVGNIPDEALQQYGISTNRGRGKPWQYNLMYGVNHPGFILLYGIKGAARLTLGLLDQLQARGPVILVGHSAGALVAMETFKRRPEAIAGFVFVAPALPNNEASDNWVWRASFTQQLRRLWTLALLQTDGPGLQYVRRQLLERREEVRRGKLGIYHEGEATQDIIEGYTRPMQADDWD
ncbi:hypothetical protein WJX74_008137 [Apatococcus lobatus]|uniref:AB hydrolase-1 domain-containing protein n=1 Tax=Apatococcus lobatus TaxID=904363 RepID=A0AAW1QCY1_9CHLO